MNQSWPSISRASRTRLGRKTWNQGGFSLSVRHSAHTANFFLSSYHVFNDRLDEHISLYGPDRISRYSLGRRLVLDPTPHEPDCEFELGITSFGLVVVRGNRHWNHAYWWTCLSSCLPIRVDSQFSRGYGQLRRVLYLPCVAYMSAIIVQCVDKPNIACSTTVNVAMSFGGQSWAISSDDFKLAQISNGECLGAIFVYSTGSGGSNSGSPAWIVGDTFLKNVYSVFRANPASVGFAAIAPDAQSSVTRNGVPTATIGSASVSVTGNHSGSAALPSALPHLVTLLFVMTTSLFYFL
jgi:hypothetical protein